MSLLLNTGADAMDSSEKGGNRAKKIGFIRLASGESVRVAFTADKSIEDNIVFASAEFLNHRDYENGVASHPCLQPAGEDCHSCSVGVPRSRRFLIAMTLLDEFVKGKNKVAAGDVAVLDVSRKQYLAIKAAVKDYVEDGSVFEMAFKLTKTGEDTSSSFAISPILKLKGDDADKLAAAQETELDEDFFELALRPKTNEQLKDLLKNYSKAEEEEEEAEESQDPSKNF